MTADDRGRSDRRIQRLQCPCGHTHNVREHNVLAPRSTPPPLPPVVRFTHDRTHAHDEPSRRYISNHLPTANSISISIYTCCMLTQYEASQCFSFSNTTHYTCWSIAGLHARTHARMKRAQIECPMVMLQSCVMCLNEWSARRVYENGG
jgi:hypothetical protein